MQATPHTFKQLQALREFAEDILDFSDLKLGGIANRKLATEFRTKHIRSGKLSGDWTTDKQWLGTDVLAIAYDEDTIFILTSDMLRISL